MTGGNVINPEDPPVLVCADLQAQYVTGEGGLACEASRCLVLLALWRMELWPVLHLKRIAQAAWFDPASGLTDWSAAFRPQPGEMVFEHPLPSAYSSARFAEYMASMKGVHCLMAGCSLDETILATVVEGFHRGHRFRVVADAVTCTQSLTGDGDDYRASIMRAIGKFAGIERSSDLIEAAASQT
jgi:nicotinamidase-related amidase